VKTTWKDAFDHMNITFGHTTEDHFYRRHTDFARIRSKRQNRVTIPQDTPDNVNTALFDLNSEVVDKTFINTDFLDIIGSVAPLPDLPINIPIEIGCKRCATTGQLALSQGAFNIDLSQIDLIPDIFQGGDDGKEISKVISGGFVELVATGLGARLELFARPSANGQFEIALFQLPIAGFTIPGIGNAGAIFEPRVRFEFSVTGGLEVNYGLDLKVPDGSSIRVELTNLAGSSITGFQDTRLTPLPVTVNITDVDILLGLAFKPTIPVGFEFFQQLKAEATATLELPRLDAKLSSNIAANCGNGKNATAPPKAPYANSTTQLSQDLIQLGPLALVEANVSISCDLGFDLSIPVLPPPFNAVSVSQNIFKANFPLVSECKSPRNAFDNASGIAIPAPPPSMSATSMPLLNATVMPSMNYTKPAYTAPMVNYTVPATTISTTAASLRSASYSAPAYLETTASSTNVSHFSPSYINATASMTSASISATPYLNISASTTSANYSTSSEPDSTTIMATSTAFASSYVNSNSTSMLNYSMPVLSTSCESRSTTVLTTTTYITSKITRMTTITPATTTTPTTTSTPITTSTPTTSSTPTT
jgi:hypothetical protein